MRNVERLLDRARELCNPPTDYELARRMGIAKQTISRVRTQGGNVDNYAAFRLAGILGMDPATVISYIEEDRATLHRKEFWRSQLPRLLATVGFAAIINALPSRAPSDQVSISPGIHYANRRKPGRRAPALAACAA